MDTADIPQCPTLTARTNPAATWNGTPVTSTRTVDLADVPALHYRAPGAFAFPDSMSGPELRFAAAQARTGSGGIITSASRCRALSSSKATNSRPSTHGASLGKIWWTCGGPG
ncbi:hypothetical protein ACFU76_32725 [Streptomyces sp. NPDC057539]|uniref:hypothetical protein n=1 Tax=Streptomyces sp. NPDC057539 TaxID=3346159 RepID=UPI0036771ED7